MYLLAYILGLSIVTYLANYKNEVDGDSVKSYEFPLKSKLIILGTFLISIALNYIGSWLFSKFYWLSVGIWLFLSVLFMSISNFLRISDIMKKRENNKQILEILKPLFKIKNLEMDVDIDNPPFVAIYDGEEIKEITISMDNPDMFTDTAVTQGTYNLNKYLPYKRWVSSVNFPDRECKYIGQNLPPWLANYPGSDLRPWNWIPLGLGGKGEVGWNLGGKELGESLYIYEDTGKQAGTTKISKAPQAMVVGPTGGGKAIPLDEFVTI